MSEIEIIRDKMKELFISVYYKYIKLNNDGNYVTFNSRENDNHFPLVDGLIEAHLLHKSTYGVFCKKNSAKFITFDVDIRNPLKAKQVVWALHYVLTGIGIPDNLIYTSISGNKGYHVDIYFNEEVEYEIIKKIFNIVYIELENLLGSKIASDGDNIELRPVYNKGVKLPLGVNFKNKDRKTNVCWYVDVYNGFRPYKSLEFILSIKKMESRLIKDLVSDFPTTSKALETTSVISSKKEKNKNDFNKIDLENETPQTLKDLFEDGLKRKGTRNISLYKLAIYLNTLGLNREKCRIELRKWMERQDTKLYDTDLATCYQEIDRCIKSVYSRNIIWLNGLAEIEITKNEILSILQYDKKLHNTISALLFHSKRFPNKDNQFFMTYMQLANATGHSIRTMITHIKELEIQGVVKVIRSPIIFEDGNFRSNPNTYELTLRKLNGKENKSVKINVENVSFYKKRFTDSLISMFTLEELGSIPLLIEEAKAIKTII